MKAEAMGVFEICSISLGGFSIGGFTKSLTSGHPFGNTIT